MTIEQDGRPVQESGGEMSVRRAPFTMVLTLPLIAAVRVRVTATADGAYERVRSAGPLSDVFRPGGAFAEGRFNEDQTLFLSADTPEFHYWCYKDDSGSRFDCVEIHETTLVARRTVAAIVSSEGVTHRLEEFGDDRLFFIVGVRPFGADAADTELGRQTFTVQLRGEATTKSTTVVRPPPETPGLRQIELAGEWRWSESIQGESGKTCTSRGVLSLREDATQLSGRVSGTETCASEGSGLRMVYPSEKFTDRLESGEISGTSISFEMGACRYQGRISETGTRMTGTMRGCLMEGTGGTGPLRLKPDRASGDWEAIHR